MTLFSAPDDPWSHRTRIVLAEKAIEIDIVDVEPGKYPEDLLDLNPYHTSPTLVDRDLVLYDSRVIMEYLDERFPHPPLMPVDPVSRARSASRSIRSSTTGTAWRARSRRARTRRTCRSCARSCATTSWQRRPVQAQAVLPVGRVLDGGCDHRAHPVAPAALRDRSAAAGAAHPQVRQHHLSRGPAFRASLSDNEREMRLA